MPSREQMTAILAAATVAVSLAALGSAPRWATCVAILLALAATLPQLASRRALTRIPPLAWLFVAAAGLTAVQLVPLPATLVGLLAPTKLMIVTDNAAALGETAPAWTPLSYAPPATAVELAKMAGYLAFTLACVRLAATARGRRALARTVAAAGVALAACALVHLALDLDALIGLYRPQAVASPLIAPLINANHQAGFLALATPLLVALGVQATGVPRVLWLTGSALTASTALLTESRGGALALGLGTALLGILLVAQKHSRGNEARVRRRLPLSVVVPMGIVAACAVTVVVVASGSGVREELGTTTTAELSDPDSKFAVWQRSIDLLHENLWTGVGRGGFEAAFTRFHHSGVKTYSHAENQYLQALLDWGVLGAAALACLFAWTCLVLVRRWRHGPLEAGALSGVIALLAHNGVDFSLELPGVALAAIAAAAILMPAALAKLPAPVRSRALVRRCAVLAAGLGALALAASPVGRTASADSDALAALLSAPGAGRGARAIAEGHRLMSRHPADYLIAGLTAQAYFRERNPRAVRVINRALLLNPKHPGLHTLAARMLIAAGRREQALIELELALRYTLQPRDVLAELVRFFPQPEDAARGIPIAAERVPIMVNRLVTMERSDVALAYARRALAENERNATILQLVSTLALQRGDHGLAISTGERAFAARGNAGDALAWARALKADGRVLEALAVLERAVADTGAFRAASAELVRTYALLAELQETLGRHRSAKQSLLTAIGLTGGDRAALAGLYRQLARVEEALGNGELAAEARRRAAELQ